MEEGEKEGREKMEVGKIGRKREGEEEEEWRDGRHIRRG